MTAVTFDTLKLAQDLEEAGFSRDQASGAARALATSFSPEVATRTDIAELRAATKADFTELQASTKADIADLRSSTNADFTKLQASTKADIAELRASTKADMGELRSSIAILEGKLSTEIAGVRTEIAAASTSTAKWIVGAVFINSITVLGGIAAVWQFAHK